MAYIYNLEAARLLIQIEFLFVVLRFAFGILIAALDHLLEDSTLYYVEFFEPL